MDKVEIDELASLVSKACSGDLGTYGRIVRAFQDMAYGCAFSILGDFHLAQDAAQEAFVEAYRKLPDLRTPAAFPGWFRRIIVKYCDRITRRKRIATVPLDEAGEVPGGGTMAETKEKEMKDMVLEAIKNLPESERMVTTLFYINGYSQKEVADFLEVSEATVNNRLYASRKRLKERMMDMIGKTERIDKMVDKTLKSVPLVKDFADVVVRKATSQEDLKCAAELVGWHAKSRPEHFKSVEDAGKAGLYVVGEEGMVDGAGYFNEVDWSIGSTVLKAVRPGEMGGESEGVPAPAFVKSFQACFKLAKQRGIHLSIVHGSQYDHVFCGFVPCFYYPVVTLSCERIKSIMTHATIIEANDKQKQTAEQALLLDPYAPKISAYIGGGIVHIIEQDGEVTGYARVNRHFVPADHCNMSFGHVPDITVQTRDAAFAVIGLAGELTQKAGGAEICMMQSHMTLIAQTILSLGGKYLLRPSCDLVGLDAEMVAIVDLVLLTQKLQSEFQSRLNASPAHHVDGCFSIEMSGTTVGFTVRSGKLEIVTRKQNVHRILPRWVVTRLYMGYYSGEDVLAMGTIPYDRSDGKTPDSMDLDMKELHLPDKETAIFKALFPKLWPCSTPDPDVWPWVIGAKFSPYRHGDKESEERKAQIDALRLPWIGY